MGLAKKAMFMQPWGVEGREWRRPGFER